jgi:hypothetical protein
VQASKTQRTRRRRRAATWAVIIIFALAAQPVSATTLPTLCTDTWQVDRSMNLGAYNNLFGVDARSPSDVWAVGLTTSTNAGLIEHWDGSEWAPISGPSPRTRTLVYVPHAVDAVTASDAWIVGVRVNKETLESRTLAEHWDGTDWTVISTPNVGGLSDAFDDDSAVSSSDAWAVGSTDYHEPLIEHWDGISWSVVPTPTLRPSPAWVASP